MSLTTIQTRQLSFANIQNKTKIRYMQILNRLNEPKTAKELKLKIVPVKRVS